KKAVAERRQELRPVVVSQYREHLRAEHRKTREHLGDQIRRQERLEEVLSKEMTDRTRQHAQLAQGAGALEALRVEIAAMEEAVRRSAAAIRTLEAESAAPPRVRVLEAASAPR